MRNFLFISLLVMGFSGLAFGYGEGISSYPLTAEKKLISAEFSGMVSSGGGAGLQARYTQNLNEVTTLDAGFGVSGGERASRIFAGVDYEIFPDYENQPKTSLKATLSNAKEFGDNYNIITLAPTVSKGFNFWGKEGFPYAALPFGVNLNSETKSYQTTWNLSAGITGKIPVEDFDHL